MDSEQFVDIAEEVFDEYLPKVPKKARAEFLEVLISELRDRGLDIDYTDTDTEPSGQRDTDLLENL